MHHTLRLAPAIFIAFAAACGSEPPAETANDNGTPSVQDDDAPLAPETVTLTLRETPHGRISAVPSGPYLKGASVTLTAIPDADYDFGGWVGLDGIDNPTIVVMTEPTTVSAHFAKGAVALSVSASPADGGEVVVSPAPPYIKGETVQVTAEPAYGYAFASWDGSTSSEPTLSLVLQGNMRLVARFARIPANVSVTSQPASGGAVTVTPAGAHFVGDDVTLSATPAAGFVFDGWSDGGSGDTRTITLEGDLAVSARFIPYPVLRGPTSHVGNESGYTLSWTYAWQGPVSLAGYRIEESLNGGAFTIYSNEASTNTTVSVTIPVNRDPAKHCYRLRARLGTTFSPYSNTHCVERLPGEKRIMIVNDVQSWVGSSGFEYNGIIRVHTAASNLWNAVNRLPGATGLPGGLIDVGDRESFSTASLPRNYAVGFVAGWWERVCWNGPCFWDRHQTVVLGCDAQTEVYKAQEVKITNHEYDTVFIYTSDWLPRGNYAACAGGTCVRDPVCQ